MKIPDKTMSQNLIDMLNRNRNRMHKLQLEVSSGEKVISIADNPGLHHRIMGMEDTLVRINGYKSNINTARQDLQLYEDMIGSIADKMREVKVSVITAGNTTNYAGSHETFKQSIEDSINSLAILANSNVTGRFMFSGSKIEQKPFTLVTSNGQVTSVVYNGDNRNKVYNLDTSDTVNINLSGEEVFKGQAGGDEDIFETLIAIKNDMDEESLKNIDDHLIRLDKILTRLQKKRGEIGTYVNHIDSMSDFLNRFQLSVEEKYSDLRYADLAESISMLLNSENIFRASLEVSARMNKLSILDFM